MIVGRIVILGVLIFRVSYTFLDTKENYEKEMLYAHAFHENYTLEFASVYNCNCYHYCTIQGVYF